MEIVRAILSRLGKFSGVVLVALLVVVCGTWAFVELLDEVDEGDSHHFDKQVLLWVEQHQGPPWVQEVMRDLTALGGLTVLFFVTSFVIGYLILKRRYHAFWLLVVAVPGGLAISMVLKAMIDRPRPDIFPHGSFVHTASFPSGHSMLSAVVYLTLGTLLARITRERVLRIYFISIAFFLTIVVGVSRVYLGVHWPTDVLAGWSAGLAWATACWLVATWLQRRGAVETTLDGDAEPVDGVGAAKP